ncbi:MAG: citramalate synthase [Alphaproteobacteria bacterium]
MAERIHLYDTTLRDGAQTQGVDFSADDKATIARALDRLGVDYVEGGWPGANPTDDAFFAAAPALGRARLAAFGMTRRPDRSAANDPGLSLLLDSGAASVCLVGKTWDFQVDVALGIARDDNLAMIADSLARVAAAGREPLFDAEHFFDGFKANPDYALACLRAAHAGGAAWLVLCDTNGGTLPDDVSRIVAAVAAALPGAHLGMHAHDDTGNAVANSLAAVEAGARMVQGTLNGLGERCGNANLTTLIPTLALKSGGRWQTGVDAAGLVTLTRTSRLLDELLNRAPDRHAPYVGEAAFAHKGGLHVAAIARDPRTYEHVDPALVGNRRHIVVSDQSGRANVLARLREADIALAPDDVRIARLVEAVKAREHEGYSYDGAEASFELLARRALGEVPSYYAVDSFRVEVERRPSAGGAATVSQAVVKVTVGGENRMEVAEGAGPVNALDAALRKALVPVYPELADVRLTDFRVRIVTPRLGTAAVVRVMVEHSDGEGGRWATVGLSDNIIEAAAEALEDGIVHLLLRRRGGPRDAH